MKSPRLLPLLVLLMLPTHAVHAAADDYVYTLNIEAGETELDFKAGQARQSDGSRAGAGSIGLGYGVSDTWWTEGYLRRDGANRANVLEWENRLILWQNGVQKLGVVSELAAPLTQRNPWELRLGLLWQQCSTDWQFNANLLFERAFGRADEHGQPYQTNLGYQLQARQIDTDHLAWGVQAMGEMGQWNRWDSSRLHTHRAGPALFGKLGKDWHYNAAWLIGLTTGAAQQTLRLQLEYEL